MSSVLKGQQRYQGHEFQRDFIRSSIGVYRSGAELLLSSSHLFLARTFGNNFKKMTSGGYFV